MKLYWFPGPNDLKATIALEETGLAHALCLVNILTGEQDGADFRRINPNGRIPALVDGDVVLFESCAILQYLGRKSGRFYPAEERLRAEVDSWLFWQASGLGPMLGQVNWFVRAAARPGRDAAETSLPLHRFRKECRRLFTVLDGQLQGRDFVCAGDYSIADMAIWPWVDKYHANAGDLLADFSAVHAWHARIAARPAVIRARAAGLDLLSNLEGKHP